MMTVNSMMLPVTNIDRIRPGTDGCGIRTLVCAAGCPLRCRYCINPHTQDMNSVRKLYSAEDLYEAVKIDNLYFLATNGGITFGGGEPGLYAAFINEFAGKYGGKWSIDIETSLNIPRENLLLLMDVIDSFIIDIKDTDPEVYKAYTGREIYPMLGNLEYLCACGLQHKMQVRIPEIKEYNNAENCDRSEAYCRSLGITEIDRFKYIVRT